MENQEQEINKLRNEISKLEKNIKWYKDTYENRSLMGIIKTKMFKPKPEKNTVTLEEELIEYLHKYHTPRKAVYNKKVSIIMLSLNRFDDTSAALKHIYKYTKVPFEVIILDNNSSEDVKQNLKKAERHYKNLRVVFEQTNLGCAGGRNRAKDFAKGEYLLFLDNDILVFPHYLENLIARVESDDKAAGVCCKTIFPDGKIQFNGGALVFDDDYALFSLIDDGEYFKEAATNNKVDCQWIPGGSTLWKRDVFNQFSVDPEMKGAFEDNEVCIRLIRAGYKLFNSPGSVVIHNHFMYKAEDYQQKEQHYYQQRNNSDRILHALLHFYKKYQLIISFAWKGNPWDIYFGLQNKEQILAFINEKLNQSHES